MGASLGGYFAHRAVRLKGTSCEFSDIVRLRLRSILHRSRVEQELDEELRDRLGREAEERGVLLRAGIAQRKEECRDTRGLSLLDAMWHDVRYGVTRRDLLRLRQAFFSN